MRNRSHRKGIAADGDIRQYEKRHDGVRVEVPHEPRGELIVERVGGNVRGERQDVGVEYYDYVDATP